MITRKGSLIVVLTFCLTATLLMIAVCPRPINADFTVTTFFVSPQTPAINSTLTFTVNIGIGYVYQMTSYEIHVDWDPTLLNLTKITNGVLLSNNSQIPTSVYKVQNNNIGTLGYIETQNQPAHDGSTAVGTGVGNGTLFTLTFAAISTGSCVLHLHDQNVKFLTNTVPNVATVDGYFNNQQGQTYQLTISASSGGTTDPTSATYAYAEGSIVNVTATPNASYDFDHWELDSTNVGSANPYSVSITNDHTLRALFTYVPPPLAVSLSPVSASIYSGQSVTFTSTASGGTPPYSYQWYLNSNPVLSATYASWTFTPTSGGTYHVYVQVTDSLQPVGNVAQSETASVTVSNPSPAAPVGGYSLQTRVPAETEPLLTYITLMGALTVVFTKLKPKTKRKR